MWEVRVTQKYTSDHGIDLEETVVFRVNNLTKAGVIVDIFKDMVSEKSVIPLLMNRRKSKIWQHRY